MAMCMMLQRAVAQTSGTHKAAQEQSSRSARWWAVVGDAVCDKSGTILARLTACYSRLAWQLRKCSPQHSRSPVTLSLCRYITFPPARPAYNERLVTTTHRHGSNRLSRLLHRLRQPARRQRRQAECHPNLRSLWRILQRYVCATLRY